METFNFDTVKPEPIVEDKPVVTPDAVATTVAEEPKKEDILVTGSLSDAYTEALNKMFVGNKVSVITESIAQCTVAIKAAYENKPKPILAYTTNVTNLSKDNITAFDDITAGLDSGLFRDCFVCIEQDKLNYTEMGYVLENYLSDRGVKVYRNQESMLAAIRGTNV